MLSPSRICVLTTAIVLALTTVACGGDDSAAKNDYVKQINAAQTLYASTVTKVTAEITKTSTARRDQSALKRFVGAIDNLLVTLRTIKVPSDVRAEHQRLIAATAGLRGDISKAAKKMRATTTTTVLADVQRQLGAATITFNAKLAAATDAINTKLRAG